MTVRGFDDHADALCSRPGADQGFIATLMLACEVPLRRMCWSYLHDSATVDDVLQDTFCRILEKHVSLTSDCDITAWAHSIAAHLCVDELRRRARRAQLHAAGDCGELLDGVADRDRAGRPEEALELDLTRRLVRAAMLDVPARQRDVLILRDVCGHSEAETAAALGVSAGSVQGTLHRARERFRERYIWLATDGALPGECGQVAFVFEHLRVSSLRKDRLGVVRRHIHECSWCRARFDRLLAATAAVPSRSGSAPERAATRVA